MDRLNCERALYRGQRTNTRVGAFQFLHDQSIRRVAYACAAMLFQVWRIKALCADTRNQIVGTFGGTMTGNDLRQNFPLHKLSRPAGSSAFFIGEKFFDFVIIERILNANELVLASLA